MVGPSVLAQRSDIVPTGIYQGMKTLPYQAAVLGGRRGWPCPMAAAWGFENGH